MPLVTASGKTVMKLNEYRNRLHSWQLNPVKYEYPGEKHRCDCCGEVHEGNFCPLCGQKSTHGPVTWKSVWAGVMEIWGMHSRSLPYTAWQLLTRPGHLMRDYVTGKRQVSFPPVKMLVILGLIVFLIGHWLDPKNYSHEIDLSASTDSLYYLNYAFSWLKAHTEWFTLFSFSFLIVPTWLVFRYAPLLQRHTLPQGFFIQTFIAIQVMTLTLIFIPFELSANVKAIATSIKICLILMYLLIDYKQLFGYSWWGTIWRGIIMLFMIVFTLFVIGTTISIFSMKQAKSMEVFGSSQAILWAILPLYLLIHFTNAINTRAWQTHGKWSVFKGPVIVVASLFTLFLLGLIIVD